MIRRLSLVDRLLGLAGRGVEAPEGYNALQRAVGSDRVWRVFLDEHLKPWPGMRLLDVGCGPAEILSFLPAPDYLGVDLHAPYLDGARRRYGERGRFRRVPVGALADEAPPPFDAVLLLGVLHHLDDARAREVLAAAARLLKPGGRLLTLDGCRLEPQSRVARFLLEVDRGRHVRDAEGYAALLRPHLGEPQATLRRDLLRLPYDHLILEACKKPLDPKSTLDVS